MITFKKFLEERGEFDPKLAYNQTLNPAIWDEFNLRPEVLEALKRIANEFIEFLGVEPSSVTDVILTGSNANYNWTEISDLDLHILLDMSEGRICPTCPSDDFIQDCFHAKKTLWNSSHDITIHGFDVELYAQDADQQSVSDSGVYSLNSQQWIKKPEFKNITIDNTAVRLKSEDIMNQIDSLLDAQTDNLEELKQIKEKIQKLRSSGLQQGGEFSIENLAFKALRNMGYVGKLHDYINNINDQQLSVK